MADAVHHGGRQDEDGAHTQRHEQEVHLGLPPPTTIIVTIKAPTPTPEQFTLTSSAIDRYCRHRGCHQWPAYGLGFNTQPSITSRDRLIRCRRGMLAMTRYRDIRDDDVAVLKALESQCLTRPRSSSCSDDDGCSGNARTPLTCITVEYLHVFLHGLPGKVAPIVCCTSPSVCSNNHVTSRHWVREPKYCWWTTDRADRRPRRSSDSMALG